MGKRIFGDLQRSKRRVLLVMLLFLAMIPTISIMEPIQTYQADSWVKDADKEGIYGKDDGTKIGGKKEEEEKSSSIGDLFWGFCNSLVTGHYAIFKSAGLTMGNIILGRIDGGGVNIGGRRVALFSFEMATGNPYGIVAMALYAIERSIVYVAISMILLYKFVAVLYVTNASKAMTELKDSVKSAMSSLVLLALMPSLLDLMLYLRDLILFVICSNASKLIGMGDINITDMTLIYAKVAVKHPGLANYMMYSASYILVIYYAYTYMTLALSMTTHVIAFPFIAAKNMLDRQGLQQWFFSFLSYLAVPIIDYTVLLVPALIGSLANNSASSGIAFIQLLSCIGVLRARKELKEAIGVQSMRSEIAGMAMLIGGARLAGSLASGTIGAATQGYEDFKAVKETNDRASYYEAMSYVDALHANGNEQFTSALNISGLNKVKDKDALLGAVRPLNNVSSSGIEEDIVEIGNVKFENDIAGTSDMKLENDIGDIAAVDRNKNRYSDSQQDNEILRQARNKIMEHYANKDNFENPMFKGISNARKAELYRERARDMERNAVGRMAGSIAGTLGGGAFAATNGMFLGPMGMTMFASGGMKMGAGVGRKLGSLTAMSEKDPLNNKKNYWTTSDYPENIEGNSNGTSGANIGVVNEEGDTYQNINAEISPADIKNSNNSDIPIVSGYVVGDSVSPHLANGIVNDKPNYEQDFMRENVDVIRQQTAKTFGSDADSETINTIFKNAKDTVGTNNYADFRENAANQFQAALRENIRSHASMCGDEKMANTCIENLVNNYTNDIINPKKDGIQIDVPQNHILSRENLSMRGYNFKS